MVIKRQALPLNAAEAALIKSYNRMPFSNGVVHIDGTNAECFVNRNGTLTIRRRGRAGPDIIPGSAAERLVQLKGLKGQQFMLGLQRVLGKAPAAMVRTGGMQKYKKRAPALAPSTAPVPGEVLSPVERAYMQR